MLQAMNTGHDGSLTTIHANTPRDALARLETMVLMAGIELPSRAIREQIVSAIQLLVHVKRYEDGVRRVASIAEITGLEGNTPLTQELFRFERRGRKGRIDPRRARRHRHRPAAGGRASRAGHRRADAPVPEAEPGSVRCLSRVVVLLVLGLALAAIVRGCGRSPGAADLPRTPPARP